MNTYHSQALSALGDATRRTIFDRLMSGPLPVGELARGLPVTRPAVSQHLKVLKEAGLVFDSPNGTRRVYRINPQGVHALRDYFDDFWTQALNDFKDAAERQEGASDDSAESQPRNS